MMKNLRSCQREQIECESNCPCNINCENGCVNCDNLICKDSILILNTFSPSNQPVKLDFKGLSPVIS